MSLIKKISTTLENCIYYELFLYSLVIVGVRVKTCSPGLHRLKTDSANILATHDRRVPFSVGSPNCIPLVCVALSPYPFVFLYITMHIRMNSMQLQCTYAY
jgi:hypothetical protein